MLTGGSRLGPYEIVAPIGAGGMGEVYRARDTRLGRDVAVKVLPAELTADADRVCRFEREARATAALSHPNILSVFDVGTHKGVPYLVEELLEGETLNERLERGGLGTPEALRIAVEIARGLAAAHDKGIVHRDLKPANVFLTREGTIKLLDFGLAKLIAPPTDDQTATDGPTLTAATGHGALLGTVPYMAPEQACGRPVDTRTDVFALGVVLYEMLAGGRPFLGSTITETAAAILKDEPAPLPAEVTAPVAAVVSRCLAKEPGQRYQRGSEVRAALEAVQSGVVLPAPARPGWPSILVAHRWLAALAALSAVLVVAAGLDVGGLRGRLFNQAGGGRAIRMAVLPFDNLSGDPEQEYLSDGITQEMISQLGRLHPEGLSVIARTSVMRYKHGDTPVDQIGRDLKVDYVLAGSTQLEVNRVRITAELIQVGDQTQLWGETYERELAGILALQSEVAERVAGALALELLPAEQARLTNVRSVNPEAYAAYLKGTYHWQKLTPGDVDTAQRYFELALEEDPASAQAYEGLAFVWAARYQMGMMPPGVAGPRAKAAAMRAVALDAASAGAHEALAGITGWVDWDWPTSGQEWRRALEINPSSANGHAYYAHFLALTGHVDEALTHSERALELDPFNALYHSLYAGVLNFQGRYDDAIAAARAALALQSDLPTGWSQLDLAQTAGGRYEEKLAAQRQRYADDPELLAALEQGLKAGGYQGAQRRIADLLAARYGTPAGRSALAVASLYFYAGDKTEAIGWLEKSCDDHDPNLPYITRPFWDPLRSDPRFQALLRKMNLPL